MANLSIFSARLKNARVMKGLSMDELCSAMGNIVSKMAISKYENGQLAPNSRVIIALSKALGLPIDYFFRPFTVQVDSVRFRKKSSLPQKKENSLRETIADLMERYINIEEICSSSAAKHLIPQIRANSAEEVKMAAAIVRKEWRLGLAGIVNVIDLLENRGIKVIEIDAPESFDGMSSLVNEKFHVVILNKAFSAERKRFTALHELGHLVLRLPKSIEKKQEESFCLLFASEMLVPEPELKRILGKARRDISYQELRAIQLVYGISCDAIMYKAKECGIISEQRYRTFCIQKNKASKFRALIETSLYHYEESTRFVSLVYKALSKELITISKAASLLHQNIEQVRRDLALV